VPSVPDPVKSAHGFQGMRVSNPQCTNCNNELTDKEKDSGNPLCVKCQPKCTNCKAHLSQSEIASGKPLCVKCQPKCTNCKAHLSQSEIASGNPLCVACQPKCTNCKAHMTPAEIASGNPLCVKCQPKCTNCKAHMTSTEIASGNPLCVKCQPKCTNCKAHMTPTEIASGNPLCVACQPKCTNCKAHLTQSEIAAADPLCEKCQPKHVDMGNMKGETRIHVHTRADGTKVRTIDEKTFTGEALSSTDDGSEKAAVTERLDLIMNCVTKGKEEDYGQITEAGKEVRKYVWAIENGGGHAFFWKNESAKLYVEETVTFKLTNMALEGHEGDTFVCKLEPGAEALLIVRPVIANTNCSIAWNSAIAAQFR
jgi:hypothetical protein